MSGSVEYTHDRMTGIVRVKGVGLWTPAQVKAHFLDLAESLRRLRSEGRPVLILADLIEGEVQSAEVAELIKTNTQEMYGRGDRIAMLVSSTIAKMQMRRIVDTAVMELFVSPKAAEIWLTAYKEDYRAA